MCAVLMVLSLAVLTALIAVARGTDSSPADAALAMKMPFDDSVHPGLSGPHPQGHHLVCAEVNVASVSGIDFALNHGTQVLSVADGEIHSTGFTGGGFGNWVKTDRVLGAERRACRPG
jgi:murein DD-endopeptidase MepM/ murein hydrolase activator NlpD